MNNYCAEPQAHPDRCGCKPDAFQIARHSRRLVEQQRERIAALEAENAALKHRCGMLGLELENAKERHWAADRQVFILRQHKSDYMEAAEGTRKALEAECERWKERCQYNADTAHAVAAERDALAAELAAIKGQEPDCDRSACGDFSPGRCDNPDCSARRDRKPALPAAPEGGEV